MKVLVLGTGGREHALAWRLSQDAEEVYLHPGNAGTWKSGISTLGDTSIDSPAQISKAAKERGISLIVIGPEALLAKGFADFLRSEGFAVVGPGQVGAQLETSKAFAKRFMKEAGIPTADSDEADSPETVRSVIAGRYPIVLKLDGLAAGKGVVVAISSDDTEDFIRRIWTLGEFGSGPHRLVIETFLPGRELSYIGVCDGDQFVAMSSASDYKRLKDGNQGPNTGGMGVISPSPLMNTTLEKTIQERVVAPTLKQLKRENIDYRGALYFGLMISEAGDPYVLEFNARFGDPETQALMLRLQGDFTALLHATAQRRLGTTPHPTWSTETAVYVVAAAENYPSTPRTGDTIEGLEQLSPNAKVFYSGVSDKQGKLATAGGRVLGIGALGKDVEACRSSVYSAISDVRFPGIQYRRDIGTGFA